MLKDLFKKKEKTTKDKILKLIDGYIDIKAYKHFPDGTKKLIYHDTGDNTITDWMRQIIMLLLSGNSLSYSGKPTSSGGSINDYSSTLTTKPMANWHTTSVNYDGYMLNGQQFLWDGSKIEGKHYPIDGNNNFYDNSQQLFALFPTKILLGTGCEYTDWDSLKEENEIENASWYKDMVDMYGNGNETNAKEQFNNLAGINESSDEYRDYVSNIYSGTVSSQGVYSGSGNLLKAVTVNDPNTSTNVSNSADMARRVGVVGAVKTFYDGTANNTNTYLMNTISDSGRLIKPQYRGAGRPCFIYFTRESEIDSKELDWDKATSDISVQKDSSSEYLNRIGFRVVIPSQTSGNSAAGVYNPLNGYTFKQIGLFNDSLYNTTSGVSTNNSLTEKMPGGTLLAVKNIQSFSKTADESVEFTWTLTI